jgi:hypothetical protein
MSDDGGACLLLEEEGDNEAVIENSHEMIWLNVQYALIRRGM